MARELYHSSSEVVLVAPASHSAAFDSSAADLQNYDLCHLIVQSGAHTSGTFVVAIEHSANGSDWEAAPADMVVPLPVNADGVIDPINGSVSTLSFGAGEANTVQALAYLPFDKRYVRLHVTGSAQMYLSAVCLRGHYRYNPVR